MARFLQARKVYESTPEKLVMSDFSPFLYQDGEMLGACLSRNAIYILNLALLAILGFAGAYIAILKYDVR